MGLLALVREHREAIEADLLRYYKVDIARDLGTERLTYRRLKGLLEALPRESSLIQATGGAAVQWSTTEHLIASLIDAVRWQTYAQQQMNSRRTIRKPEPIQRPTDKPTALGSGKGMTPEELQRKLAQPRIAKGGQTIGR